MARRPIFIPQGPDERWVRTELLDFTWHPGQTLSQKRLSIASLHGAARTLLGPVSVPEVSSRSPEQLGVALSAFNLTLPIDGSGRRIPVECAFQGSKVFEGGGPFTDLFDRPPAEAKRDDRLRSAGRLVRFRFREVEWSTEPRTAFYDWLYLSALSSRTDLLEQLRLFCAFTDIEFNPERSFSCQAHSVALTLALRDAGLLAEAVAGPAAFLRLINSRTCDRPEGGQGQMQLI